MAKEPAALCSLARGGSRGHGQYHRRAAQELAEEVQGLLDSPKDRCIVEITDEWSNAPFVGVAEPAGWPSSEVT
jgi:hypothetical protein